MKRNQQIQPNFDPTQPAELTMYPDWNHGRPFVIRDLGESLMPLAEALQAEDARKPRNVASTAIKAATAASESLTGHRATIAAKLYDIANGSSMYELLKQKRQDEKDLGMARKLGLVSTVYCQRHERELAKVRSLV